MSGRAGGRTDGWTGSKEEGERQERDDAPGGRDHQKPTECYEMKGKRQIATETEESPRRPHRRGASQSGQLSVTAALLTPVIIHYSSFFSSLSLSLYIYIYLFFVI